jgi:hypothetical protein
MRCPLGRRKRASEETDPEPAGYMPILLCFLDRSALCQRLWRGKSGRMCRDGEGTRNQLVGSEERRITDRFRVNTRDSIQLLTYHLLT